MNRVSPTYRDDFQLRKNDFILPENTMGLESATKRALTICNLFVHHQLSISTIEQLLDENTGNIVRALLKHQIIEERRHKQWSPPLGIDRRIRKP